MGAPSVTGPRIRPKTGRNRNALTNLLSGAKSRSAKDFGVGRHQSFPVDPSKPSTELAQLGGGPVAKAGLQTVSPTPARPLPDFTSTIGKLSTGVASVPNIAPIQPAPPPVVDKSGTNSSGARTGKTDVNGGKPDENMALGQQMAQQKYGWSGQEWEALKDLWMRESGWNTHAANPTSSARGIPQIMMSIRFGSDWEKSAFWKKFENDPAFQIRVGLNYIKNRYGSPSKAWAHSQQTGWY